MDTSSSLAPKQSPPASPGPVIVTSQPETDTEMPLVDDATPAPAVPFERHPQEFLPNAILKAYPAGNPAAQSRTTVQETAFQKRTNEILRTMSAQDMENRYKEVAAQIVETLDENERKDEEIKTEIEKLIQARELEIKVWKKMREMRD